MNVNELIPGHIYYVKTSVSEYIFEYVKVSKSGIVLSKPRYYHVERGRINYSPYSDEKGLCRLFDISNIMEIREATFEEAKLLGVENYNNSKLKINHKQFKLKFIL